SRRLVQLKSHIAICRCDSGKIFSGSFVESCGRNLSPVQVWATQQDEKVPQDDHRYRDQNPTYCTYRVPHRDTNTLHERYIQHILYTLPECDPGESIIYNHSTHNEKSVSCVPLFFSLLVWR